jgi:hypothetical protein
LEKDATILLRSGDLSDALCFDHTGILIRTYGYTVVVCVGFLVEELKSQSNSRGKFRMILSGSRPEGSRVCTKVVSELDSVCIL